MEKDIKKFFILERPKLGESPAFFPTSLLEDRFEYAFRPRTRTHAKAGQKYVPLRNSRGKK